jgi:hypothetical protein
MSPLGYAIYDADNHYYEPDDCFTRRIEAAHRGRTVRIDRAGDSPGRMYLGDERCHFFSVGTGDSIGPPGIMKEFLRGLSDDGGSPSLNPMNGLEISEFVDRNSRLAKMDEQNVEACLMLPTTGVGVEPQLRDHPELLYPSVRAFNRWLEDDVPGLVDMLGAGYVLNGSDYPHPEGLLWPEEFTEELEGLSDDTVKRIMRDNLAKLVA